MIRKANRSDSSVLIKLNQKLTTYHHDFDPYFILGEDDPGVPAYINKVLADKYSQIFVAEEEGKVVGYTIARIKRADTCLEPELFGKLSHTYLEEGFRGKGIGSNLLNKSMDWLKSQGIKNIELSVHEKNPEAIKLYRKLGFMDYQKTMRKDL